jgi:hypothetical protein
MKVPPMVTLHHVILIYVNSNVNEQVIVQKKILYKYANYDIWYINTAKCSAVNFNSCHLDLPDEMTEFFQLISSFRPQ